MPTELFKVTCVTCQAKLSVRNAALVGQIVACPKCNSMVEIAPATEPARVVAVAFEDPLEESKVLLSEPAGLSIESRASEDKPGGSRDIPTSSSEPVEFGSVLETAATSSNVNFIIWSVASFVVGATLTGLFLVFRAGSGEEQVTANQPTISTSMPESEPAATNPETSKPPAVGPQPRELTPKTTDSVVAVEEKTRLPVAESTLLGPIEEPAEEKVTVATAPIASDETEPEPKLVIAQPQSPRVARKFDPLALDPEQLDLSTVTEATGVENTADEAEIAAGETPPAEAPPVNLPVQLNNEARGLSGTRSANVQLRKVLASLVVKDIRLLDFLTLISQLAGVPVSVAPEQLQMAGIRPGRQVSLDLKSTSLSDVLDDALTPLHLEVMTDGPQVVIIREGADRVRSVDYPVDDLLGNQVTASDISEWIEQLIAPETWQGRGGDGQISVSAHSLTIEQTQGVHYQVLFFLERIRLAKDMPLRSRYPEQLLSAKPLATGVADRLKAPTTFTFSHETPLAEVIRHWQSEAGLPIFIDWPALATENLWPDSLVTCAIANEAWRTALDKILTPLDLGWRPAPGGGIQITSRARIETEPQLEIYAERTWRGDSADAVVINDPVNKLTYVRAPASRLRLSND